MQYYDIFLQRNKDGYRDIAWPVILTQFSVKDELASNDFSKLQMILAARVRAKLKAFTKGSTNTLILDAAAAARLRKYAVLTAALGLRQKDVTTSATACVRWFHLFTCIDAKATAASIDVVNTRRPNVLELQVAVDTLLYYSTIYAAHQSMLAASCGSTLKRGFEKLALQTPFSATVAEYAWKSVGTRGSDIAIQSTAAPVNMALCRNLHSQLSITHSIENLQETVYEWVDSALLTLFAHSCESVHYFEQAPLSTLLNVDMDLPLLHDFIPADSARLTVDFAADPTLFSYVVGIENSMLMSCVAECNSAALASPAKIAALVLSAEATAVSNLYLTGNDMRGIVSADCTQEILEYVYENNINHVMMFTTTANLMPIHYRTLSEVDSLGTLDHIMDMTLEELTVELLA